MIFPDLRKTQAIQPKRLMVMCVKVECGGGGEGGNTSAREQCVAEMLLYISEQ